MKKNLAVTEVLMTSRHLIDIIIVLIVGTLFFSCKEKVSNKNTSIINVDVEHPMSIKTSDVMESVKVIPLETNDQCLMGDVCKILFVNKKFYILDYTFSTLLIFNEDGSFDKKLAKQGHGPGEYVNITDFSITADFIYILNSGKQSILKYNHDLQFIEEVKHHVVAINFCPVDNYIWFYKEPSNTPNDYFYACMDKDGHIQMHLNKPISANQFNWGGVNTFGFDKTRTCTSPRYGNKIYQISGNSLTPLYEINFVNHNLPKDKNIEDYDITSPDFDYAVKNNFYLSDKYFIFDYQFSDSYGICFCDNVTKEVVSGIVDNDLLHHFPFYIRWGNDNHLIGDIQAIVVKEEFTFLENHNELTKNVQEDDNPFIILYRLKD